MGTNRKLAGGGPLMDVVICSLSACRYLTNEEPSAISAYSLVNDQDGRFTDIEEAISWTMKFPSGIVASCNSTYGANMRGIFASMEVKACWTSKTPSVMTDCFYVRTSMGKRRL